MFIEIEKWHGLRNDFIVTWIHPNDNDLVLPSLIRQAKSICDRRSGVGADGILVLHINPQELLTPTALTIINSDGSLAKNCGNGLRCAAMSVRRKNHIKGDPKSPPEGVVLPVDGVNMNCRFVESGSKLPLISVEMPEVISGDQLSWSGEVEEKIKSLEKKFDFSLEGVKCYEIGNPHVVVDTPDCSNILMQSIGAEMQSGLSIDGINVHIITSKEVDKDVTKRGKQEIGQSIGELVLAYVWERGIGPTQACGSGACSVGIYSLSTGLIDRQDSIAIDMPGGRSYVSQKQEGGPVTLAGPADFVFEGKLEL
jgi:diaminopimelate epimerase